MIFVKRMHIYHTFACAVSDRKESGAAAEIKERRFLIADPTTTRAAPLSDVRRLESA